MTGLHDAEIPAGFTVISAEAAEEDRLRTLDELLREDLVRHARAAALEIALRRAPC
ncbi:MAG: hypothetical protein ACJ73E_05830 [Mycobacteriales bacterium]